MAQTISKHTVSIQPPYSFTEISGYRVPGASSVVRGISRALSRRRFSAYVRARTVGRVSLEGWTNSRMLNPADSVFGTACRAAQDIGSLCTRFTLWLVRLLCGACMAGTRFASESYYAVYTRVARKHFSRLNYAIVMGVFVAVIFSSSFYGMGFEVYLDGKPVGFVTSRQQMESVVDNAESRVSSILKMPYQMVPDITYQYGIINRRDMADLSGLEDSLFAGINGVEKLYVLSVDGEMIGASRDRKTLDDQLSAVLKKYSGDGKNGKAEFMRNVEITQQYTSTDSLLSADALSKKLNSNICDQKTYKVQSGDTVAGIALKNGMSAGDLAALNPGLKEANIKAGAVITVKNALPFLPVELTQKAVYSETIPFESKTVEDDTLYKGQKKVITEGKNGEAQITADVVYQNGDEMSRKVVSRVVVSEPITKVTSVGTKAVPAKAPTGSFIRPFRGIVTSNYGYRGREFHTGVDFAGPVGSPIVAADGGTVVFAGWNGNYGKCVIISHGNGIETLYGHSSKLLVTVGQKVAKGELIARVGSTGRSTGPHCHFEVRVNGNDVSPWKYIR